VLPFGVPVGDGEGDGDEEGGGVVGGADDGGGVVGGGVVGGAVVGGGEDGGGTGVTAPPVPGTSWKTQLIDAFAAAVPDGQAAVVVARTLTVTYQIWVGTPGEAASAQARPRL
jgi:hypothetical protein